MTLSIRSEGNMLPDMEGGLAEMMSWKNYKFFVVNVLYWHSQHFRDD